MMRVWHQCMSTQPRVAAASDGSPLCLFTHVDICKKLTHSNAAGLDTDMYCFDHPEPTYLNATPCDTALKGCSSH